MSRSRQRVFRVGLLASLLLAVALPSGSAQAASLPTVSIAVTPSSATVSGALVSGAVNIVTTDTGAKEAAVILARVNPGVTLAEVEAFANSKKSSKDPNEAAKVAAIVFDAEANPGAPSEAQTELQAGQYVLLVAVGEGQAKLQAHFTVATSPAAAALPPASSGSEGRASCMTARSSASKTKASWCTWTLPRVSRA
jgi:hypothetical protein